MSRRSEAEGTTLQGALTGAIASVLDCEPEKVELSLAAPGVDDLVGEVRVQIEVTQSVTSDDVVDPSAAAPHEDEEAEPELGDRQGAEAEPEDREDAAEDARPSAPRSNGRGSDEEPELTPQDLDDEADAAADFLEGLLDAMDLPGDLRLRVHHDHAEIEVVDIGSGALIGRRGQTLEAIQELLRCALQREFQRRARVKVDAEGYRARRMEKLVEKAEEAIDLVLDTGEAQRLEPMDVFERKAVHQIVADVDGLLSRSQGREPARRVIIERE